MLKKIAIALVALSAIGAAVAPTSAHARGRGGRGFGRGFYGRGFGWGYRGYAYPAYGYYGYGGCWRTVRSFGPWGPTWRRVWVCG
jgi:hypothetical protein